MCKLGDQPEQEDGHCVAGCRCMHVHKEEHYKKESAGGLTEGTVLEECDWCHCFVFVAKGASLWVLLGRQ